MNWFMFGFGLVWLIYANMDEWKEGVQVNKRMHARRVFLQ